MLELQHTTARLLVLICSYTYKLNGGVLLYSVLCVPAESGIVSCLRRIGNSRHITVNNQELCILENPQETLRFVLNRVGHQVQDHIHHIADVHLQ